MEILFILLIKSRKKINIFTIFKNAIQRLQLKTTSDIFRVERTLLILTLKSYHSVIERQRHEIDGCDLVNED